MSIAFSHDIFVTIDGDRMLRPGRRTPGIVPILIVLLMAFTMSSVADQLEPTVSPCFIPNRGQVRSTASIKNSPLFTAKIGGMTVCFRADGISYLIPTTECELHDQRTKPTRTQDRYSVFRLDVDFIGANSAVHIQSNGEQSALRNYYFSDLPAPVLDVPSFDEIRYVQLYNGIDLRFRFEHGQLKYDYIVASGADPSRIAMRATNADGVSIDDDLGLIIHHPFGRIQDLAPTASQVRGDATQMIDVGFELRPGGIVGFALPQGYDRTRELILDPAITWSTFFGGTRYDEASDVVVDHRGNLIVCGSSGSDVFPGAGTFNQGSLDFFVSMFNPDRTLNTTTYYGGPDVDIAFGVAVDKNDNVFICGESKSQDLNFLKNVFQWSNSNPITYADAIVVKFTNKLKFSTGTFIGGGDEDVAYDIAVDPDGNVVMAGKTQSDNFPTLSARYPLRFGTSGDVDAFVCRWSNTLNLLWSTYYGGKYQESATCIATDQSDNVYVGGWTTSGNLAALDGFQQKLNGTSDGFLVTFTPLGFPLHATLFGGNGDENINALDVAFGRIIASGFTGSGNDLPNFGVKQAQDRAGGLSDGFVLMTDLNLGPKWSTYWGGFNFDVFYGARFNVDSTVVIAGYTESPDFPLKRSIQLPHLDRIADIVLAKFSFTGNNLWSTVIGGSNEDYCVNFCTDAVGNMYLVGNTLSDDFPMVKSIFPTKSTQADCVILKVCPTTPMITLTPNDTVICQGTSVSLGADPTLSRFQWSTGAVGASITVNASGRYWYHADSPLGCNAYSDSVQITVQQSIPTVVFVRGKTSLCIGDSVIIHSRDRFDGYSWRDATGNEVGTADSLVVRSPGSYHLKVVDKTGCHDSSATITISQNARPRLKYAVLIDGSQVGDSAAHDIQLCEGQTIRFEAAKSFSPLVFWSDGSSGTFHTITTTQSVWAFVTDSIGCLWSMDTINVVFIPKQKLIVQAADSTCIGSIVELKAIPNVPGAKYRWSIDGGSILSQADSGVVVVSWNSLGTKNIKVSIVASVNCLDTGIHALTVQSKLVGGIVPIGSLRLCPGTNVQLSAPTGYSHYQWNGQVGTSSYTTGSPGKVYLEFDNGGGCVGYDTVEIVRSLAYDVDVASLDYDTLRLDSLRQMRIRIRNTGADSMMITDLLRDAGQYNIDSTAPPILQYIKPGDSAVIFVTFVPTQIGEHRDTVVIRFRQPCQDSAIVTLRGVGKGVPPAAVIRFSFPDLVLDPLQPTQTFPVMAWMDINQSGLSLDSLVFTLDLNPSMMRIISATNGVVTSSFDRVRRREQTRIAVALDTLTFDPTEITRVSANVFLGDIERDSLRMTSAERRPLSPSSMVLCGSEMRYTGLCTANGVRLLGQGQALRMMITPHPITEDAALFVSTAENGNHVVKMFDSNGSLVFEQRYLGKLGQTYAVHVPSGLYSSGMYTVTVQSPTQVVYERVLIVH